MDGQMGHECESAQRKLPQSRIRSTAPSGREPFGYIAPADGGSSHCTNHHNIIGENAKSHEFPEKNPMKFMQTYCIFIHLGV